MLNVLLLPCMLFIGTLSPSDGVDGPIDKSPIELLVTAAIIFSVGILLMYTLKLIGVLDENYSEHQ